LWQTSQKDRNENLHETDKTLVARTYTKLTNPKTPGKRSENATKNNFYSVAKKQQKQPKTMM
jgi:hypothetical protein